MDAAIAANAAFGLMEPVLNGIGGDCFVIVWDPKTHKRCGYSGSGPSAKGHDLAKMKTEVKAAYLKAGMRLKDHIPAVGALPITVPGTVDAWGMLHDRFGKLSLANDLAPAIAYANDGFPVTQPVAKYWKGNLAAFDRMHGLIEESANARQTYLTDGHLPAEGEVFRNPDLARTLTMIAQVAVMKDGAPYMVFGLMGGDMQPQGHIQVLTNMIDYGMHVQDAGDTARWRRYGNAEPTGEALQGIGSVKMESGFDPAVKAELIRRGYKVVPGTGNFGGYEAIRFDAKQHVYWGVTKMRKDGEVIGY